jgi:cytochrome c oxidase assembly protein subunit 15
MNSVENSTSPDESLAAVENSGQDSARGAQPRWLHRLSVLAVLLVWPLIWVGGLVTTYDAGMAVPDWPGTYGYNLFLYPLSTWLYGPFDLFIEHGHRLLGAVVGVVAIGMVVAAWITEPRRSVFWLTIGILVAVISQGALGGIRVLLSDRTVAMIHGCFGPVVFVLCCLAAVVTGRRWLIRTAAGGSNDGAEPSGGKLLQSAKMRRLGRMSLTVSVGVVVLSYWQLLLGAQMRHVQATMSAGWFTLLVALHIVSAFVLWLLTPILYGLVRRCGDLTLSRPASWLVWFVGLQILLGIGTWTANYGWPSVLGFLPFGEGFLVRAKGFVDSIVVTAHVAVGSLILATSAVVLLQVIRQSAAVESTPADEPDYPLTSEVSTPNEPLAATV